MIKLYLDHDSSARALVAGLRRRGVDVLTTREAGLINSPDNEQPEFATVQGRAIYSANVADFARLHARAISAGLRHGGVILRSNQYMPVGQQVVHLADLVRRAGPEDVANRLIFLDNWTSG